MLAILYLLIAIWMGDVLCRRFLAFGSFLHRAAAAVTIGLFVSTWVTFIGVSLSPRSPVPLLFGNLAFVAFFWALQRYWKREPVHWLTRPPGRGVWDVFFVALWGAAAVIMTYSSLNWRNGVLLMGGLQWSDFGATTALIQSFVDGLNFPPEYPHFPGPPISYHFLFHFQTANLEWLGLRLHTSFNLLSILSLVSMLILLMTLGERLFRSRAVGRLGAMLFFFHSALSYAPFLSQMSSFRDAALAILKKGPFLDSIYPYRGEAWGIWTLNIVANQRHLPSAIAMFLLVLVFLVDAYDWRLRWPQRPPPPPASAPTAEETTGTPADLLGPPESSDAEAGPMEEQSPALALGEPGPGIGVSAVARPAAEGALAESSSEAEPPAPPVSGPEPEPDPGPAPVPGGSRGRLLAGFCFMGFGLGLLPIWNGPMYLGGVLVLLGLFVLLPLRAYMFGLLSAAAVTGLPQLLIWRPGGGSEGARTYPMLRFGYVVPPPESAQTLGALTEFVGRAFRVLAHRVGLQGGLTPPAPDLHMLSGYVAFVWSVLKYLAFTFGFKWILLFAALILARRLGRSLLIACFALPVLALSVQFSIEEAANHKFFFIWIAVINVAVAWVLTRIARRGLFGAASAVLLTLSLTLAGFIDIFPFVNDPWIEEPMEGNKIYEWVKANTDPHDIFMTDALVTHQILLAGRKLFYGYDYYAWSAGYPTAERVALLHRLYSERDPSVLVHMLNENNIKYVCFDDPFSQGPLGVNEFVFRSYFEKVFEDDGRDHFRIYKVPSIAHWEQRKNMPPFQPLIVPTPVPSTPAPPPARFDRPLGITVLPNGDALVACAGMNTIHRISEAGDPLGGFGHEPYNEPQGVAADAHYVYVADTWNSRVLRLDAAGQPNTLLVPPPDGYYAPRDVAVGPKGDIFVVNTGRAEIVRYNPDGSFAQTWGTKGSGPGEFDEPLALTTSATELYVADYANARVQVFSFDGHYLRQWPIAAWKGGPQWYRPGLAVTKGHVYVSDPVGKAILSFTPTGERVGKIVGEDMGEPQGITVAHNGHLLVSDLAKGAIMEVNVSEDGRSGDLWQWSPLLQTDQPETP